MSNLLENLPGPRASEDSIDKDSGDAELQKLEHQINLIWMRARAVAQQLTGQDHLDMESAAYGLLKVIRREGSIRLTDLAMNVGVGKSSVSRKIAFLESIGLVSKEVDPMDRRAQSIFLTHKGEEKMRQVQDARRHVFREHLREWQVEELAELADRMGRLNSMYERVVFPKDGPAACDDRNSRHGVSGTMAFPKTLRGRVDTSPA